LWIDSVSNCCAQMKVYKRIVVEQNLIGPWADAKFYATGDEMVCQFIEAAYPEVLDSNEPIEEQVRSTHATAKFGANTAVNVGNLRFDLYRFGGLYKIRDLSYPMRNGAPFSRHFSTL
jgi:hypothetical protein